MANAVTAAKAGGALAGLAGLKNALSNVVSTMPASMTDPFMRLLKDGGWVYGQENIEVEDGSLWAGNPLSIRHGWSCWTNYPDGVRKKNELLGERMVPASQPLPSLDELEEHIDDATGKPWPWREQLAITFVCLTGEDRGVAVLYKTSSVGGMNASRKLLEAIMKQLDTNADKPVPVVEFTSEHYVHKNYGKTYVPVLRIDHFVELANEMPIVEDDGVAGDTGDDGTVEEQVQVQEQPAPQPQRQRRAAAGAGGPEAPRARDNRQSATTKAAPDYQAGEQQAQPARRRRAASEQPAQQAPAEQPQRRTRRFS